MSITARPATPLPDGLVVAWYGDDFTGSAAVMEALTFAGLESVLFFDVPTQAQRARFAHVRGLGIAGAARSRGPEWMAANLPPVFRALAALEAPLTHYKVCSTFDSAPRIGSIGRASELALEAIPATWVPLVTAAPPIHRYQAFGNLFASVAGTAYRLDRHPTMSRHPATPMDEGDLRVHLAKQTDLAIGLVDLVAMKAGRANDALEAERARGARFVALDVVDDETLAAAGALMWEQGGVPRLAVGSQGVEYALLEYWRQAGLIPAAPPPFTVPKAERMAVVSGSCSPVTAEQIDWAETHGFAPIRIDPARVLDPRAWDAEIDRAASAALDAAASGRDPLIFTARGPGDAAIAAFRTAVEADGADPTEANAALGEGLGRGLGAVLQRAGIRRAVIAGGDTSSHGAMALGLYALTALAATVPGAALCRAWSDGDLDGIELALKGGQMGSPDYFGRIRDGGSVSHH